MPSLPFQRCKLCRKLRRSNAFRWQCTSSGKSGVSRRCRRCRERPGKRTRKPGLPLPRYRIREHALQRYIERVRPEWQGLAGSRQRALEELIVRIEHAPMRERPPEWLVNYGAAWPGVGALEGYLELDVDTVLIVGFGRRGWRSARARGAQPRIRTVLTRPQPASTRTGGSPSGPVSAR